MRAVTIEFGGATRTLRYRVTRDRPDIEKACGGKKLWRCFAEDLCGAPEGTAPKAFFANPLRFVEGGSPDVLAAFIWVGIRHHDKAITLEVCQDWLQEYVDAENPQFALVYSVLDAVYLSGILGIVVDMDAVAAAEAEKLTEEARDAEGKGSSGSSKDQPQTLTAT